MGDLALLEARGEALKKLSEDGYRLNWPGRLVVRMNPPFGNPDGVYFAIAKKEWRARDWLDPTVALDPMEASHWKVFLEARYVAWRWWDRWHWRTDRLYVYALTDAEFDAFVAFVKSGETPF